MKKLALLILVLMLALGGAGCTSKAAKEPVYLINGITMGMTREQVEAHDIRCSTPYAFPYTLLSGVDILGDESIFGTISYCFNDEWKLYRIQIHMLPNPPEEEKETMDSLRAFSDTVYDRALDKFIEKYGVEHETIERETETVLVWRFDDIEIEYCRTNWAKASFAYISRLYAPPAIDDTI